MRGVGPGTLEGFIGFSPRVDCRCVRNRCGRAAPPLLPRLSRSQASSDRRRPCRRAQQGRHGVGGRGIGRPQPTTAAGSVLLGKAADVDGGWARDNAAGFGFMTLPLPGSVDLHLEDSNIGRRSRRGAGRFPACSASRARS
jgi:hypothetical protein